MTDIHIPKNAPAVAPKWSAPATHRQIVHMLALGFPLGAAPADLTIGEAAVFINQAYDALRWSEGR